MFFSPNPRESEESPVRDAYSSHLEENRKAVAKKNHAAVGVVMAFCAVVACASLALARPWSTQTGAAQITPPMSIEERHAAQPQAVPGDEIQDGVLQAERGIKGASDRRKAKEEAERLAREEARKKAEAEKKAREKAEAEKKAREKAEADAKEGSLGESGVNSSSSGETGRAGGDKPVEEGKTSSEGNGTRETPNGTDGGVGPEGQSIRVTNASIDAVVHQNGVAELSIAADVNAEDGVEVSFSLYGMGGRVLATKAVGKASGGRVECVAVLDAEEFGEMSAFSVDGAKPSGSEEKAVLSLKDRLRSEEGGSLF